VAQEADTTRQIRMLDMHACCLCMSECAGKGIKIVWSTLLADTGGLECREKKLVNAITFYGSTLHTSIRVDCCRKQFSFRMQTQLTA
jgi:hypothetical protein